MNSDDGKQWRREAGRSETSGERARCSGVSAREFTSSRGPCCGYGCVVYRRLRQGWWVHAASRDCDCARGKQLRLSWTGRPRLLLPQSLLAAAVPPLAAAHASVVAPVGNVVAVPVPSFCILARAHGARCESIQSSCRQGAPPVAGKYPSAAVEPILLSLHQTLFYNHLSSVLPSVYYDRTVSLLRSQDLNPLE